MEYKSSCFNFEYESFYDYSVVCNLRSMTIAKIKKSTWDLIHNGELDNDLINSMAAKGFIVPIDYDEFAAVLQERDEFINSQNSETMSFVVAPTMSCNANCHYCFQKNQRDTLSMSNSDSGKVADYIASELSRNHRCRRLRITWFGGEPLLSLSQIRIISRKIKNYCKNNSILFSSNVITNGILLNERTVDILIEEANLRNVQITIDGTPERYSIEKGVPPSVFYRVIDNVISACEKLQITIRINVSENTEQDAIALCNYLLGPLGIKGKVKIYFAPLVNFNDVDKDGYRTHGFIHFINLNQYPVESHVSFQDSIPVVKKAYCPAMHRSFRCIGPDLKLYRCEHCLLVDGMEIGDIFNGYNAESFADRAFQSLPFDACKKCLFLPVCQGGCAGKRLLNGIKPDCYRMNSIVHSKITNLLRLKGKGEL